MQIIYLAPFVLLSAISGAIFLVIPRLRRYAMQAAAVPVAFSTCSIVGMGAIVIAVNYFGALAEPLAGTRGIVAALLVYVICGAAGGWLSTSIIGRIQRGRVERPER